MAKKKKKRKGQNRNNRSSGQAKKSAAPEAKKAPSSGKAAKAAPNPNSRAAQRARRAKKAKRDRWLLIGAVGAVVAVVVALAVASGSDDVGVTEAAAFDLPALEEGGNDVDDDRFQLSDYGGSPLVVNFFASWCTSCESELPRFVAAGETFEDELEIIFVNSNETGNWRPMAERTGIIDKALVKDINGSNGNGLYRSLGGSGGMPLTAFYDADGNVVHVDLGELSTEALAVRLEQFFGLAA